MNWNNKLEIILALFYFNCNRKFWECVFQFTSHGSIWALERRKRCSNVTKSLEDTAIENLGIYFFGHSLGLRNVVLVNFKFCWPCVSK